MSWKNVRGFLSPYFHYLKSVGLFGFFLLLTKLP